MKAPLELIAETPRTYLVRLHEVADGDCAFLDPYVGIAVIRVRDDLIVIKGLTVPDGYGREAREAIIGELGKLGGKTFRFARVFEKPIRGGSE